MRWRWSLATLTRTSTPPPGGFRSGARWPPAGGMSVTSGGLEVRVGQGITARARPASSTRSTKPTRQPWPANARTMSAPMPRAAGDDHRLAAQAVVGDARERDLGHRAVRGCRVCCMLNILFRPQSHAHLQMPASARAAADLVEAAMRGAGRTTDHLRHVPAQAARQFGLLDALLGHGLVHASFAPSKADGRTVAHAWPCSPPAAASARFDVERKRCFQRIDGLQQRLLLIGAEGDGPQARRQRTPARCRHPGVRVTG